MDAKAFHTWLDGIITPFNLGEDDKKKKKNNRNIRKIRKAERKSKIR